MVGQTTARSERKHDVVTEDRGHTALSEAMDILTEMARNKDN